VRRDLGEGGPRDGERERAAELLAGSGSGARQALGAARLALGEARRRSLDARGSPRFAHELEDERRVEDHEVPRDGPRRSRVGVERAPEPESTGTAPRSLRDEAAEDERLGGAWPRAERG